MGLDARSKKGGSSMALPPKPAGPLVEKELEEQKKVIEMQQVCFLPNFKVLILLMMATLQK